MASMALRFGGVLARQTTRKLFTNGGETAFIRPAFKCLSTATPNRKKEMYDVTFETADGAKFTVQGREGDTLLDVVVNNDVDLDGFGACEGTLACSTCHLVFQQDDFDKIDEPVTDEELDMLDLAYGLTDTRVCVSLSGSGFLGIYMLGAVRCLQTYWPSLLQRASVAGASAGALLGSCVVCGVPHDVLKDTFMVAAAESHKWTLGPFSPNYKIEDHLRQGLDALPANAHEVASGRLFISLTRVRDGKNVLISSWDSREELIDCLLCSSFIPIFSGHRFPSFRGEKYLDGGFSNTLPVVHQPAITISPFDSLVDISPRKRDCRALYINIAQERFAVNLSNLVKVVQALKPPPLEVLEEMYRLGHRHALTYLKQHRAHHAGHVSHSTD